MGGREAVVLVDGNNFYASCEAVVDPAVIGRPLVVLSNNDGCIVSRSAEARALGIRMGQPYFQVQRQLERLGVLVRSSNYALYADMSQRLMAVLEEWVEALEIYSIDEAFGLLHRPGPDSGTGTGSGESSGDLTAWGHALRRDVRRRLGLPVAVGIAPTKVLAKLANKWAKSTPAGGGAPAAVFDLGACAGERAEAVLTATAIEDVWGIGRKLARWCRLRGVAHALALRELPTGELRQRCGVVGLRLQQELRGHACLPLELVPPAKRPGPSRCSCAAAPSTARASMRMPPRCGCPSPATTPPCCWRPPCPWPRPCSSPTSPCKKPGWCCRSSATARPCSTTCWPPCPWSSSSAAAP
jgi:DNA polymerase V